MAEVFAHPQEIPIWTDAIEGRAVDWDRLMHGYVAQVDWPGASFWPELLDANPDALVILSVRDPDVWYTSATKTIFQVLSISDGEMGPWMVSMKRLLGERFCADLADRDAMIAALERHNDEVRHRVPSSQLLEWRPEDGWGPICARLGVPVVEEPFPHSNTTADFKARWSQQQASPSTTGAEP
jgi:Sulfotransferase domain